MEETQHYEYETKELEQWQVDKYIEIIKQNNQELEKYKNILDKRIEELKQQYKEKEDKINRENYFLLTTLREYAMSQEDLKSTKTQYKWQSLSGDIIIKKSLPKTVKPTKDKFDKIEKSYPDLIETEEVKKLNWKDLKSKIVVQNGVPYDKETGEDLSEFVGVEMSEESVQIK